MPEVQVDIIWPDSKKDSIYSPSTVIKNYFASGESITVAEFETKVTEALIAASNRVKERFGFECTSAMGELARLRSILNNINDKSRIVQVIDIN